jgi:glycosyltransferase A (GT-A) superfamily protein (DUF2064 family)
VTVLLVVAKSPVAGRVKTRLCPPATPVQAARIAAAALLDTMAAVRATAGVTPVLALAGRLADADAYPGVGDELAAAADGWAVLPQRGDGLGDRLANAYADVVAGNPGRPVLQIGMDTPQLTAVRLASAVASLAAAGTVLGRAVDGGWWALGLAEPRHAEVLRGVPMSTPHTGWDTWAALHARGLSVAALPLLRDVDEWPDALLVAPTIPGSRFAGQVAAVRSSGQPTAAGSGR